jgi:hypothetical protein
LRKKAAAPRAKAKTVRWEVIRLKSTPAQLLAVVEAKDSALKVAAERLHLRLVDLPRLIVRRVA